MYLFLDLPNIRDKVGLQDGVCETQKEIVHDQLALVLYLRQSVLDT